jgi:hypothetical protein
LVHRAIFEPFLEPLLGIVNRMELIDVTEFSSEEWVEVYRKEASPEVRTLLWNQLNRCHSEDRMVPVADGGAPRISLATVTALHIAAEFFSRIQVLTLEDSLHRSIHLEPELLQKLLSRNGDIRELRNVTPLVLAALGVANCPLLHTLTFHDTFQTQFPKGVRGFDLRRVFASHQGIATLGGVTPSILKLAAGVLPQVLVRGGDRVPVRPSGADSTRGNSSTHQGPQVTMG